MSMNVITTPSMRSDVLRYGRIRVRYQRPSSSCTSRTIGVSRLRTRFGILFEIIVSKPVCQVREWPATVGHAHIEKFADLRREADNSKIAIQKQRGNVRGCHEVLQVARQCGELGHFMSVFLIDRLQLLVHALQFFLACLQLFQRRAEFFVGRLQLLVRRLEFLLARFILFDDALQTLP